MSYKKLIQTYRESDNLVDWLQRFVAKVAEVENWREIGGSGNPSFENSWVNYAVGYNTAAFYKDPFGRVHIKGSIKTGASGSIVFTFPEGYRPDAWALFANTQNGGSAGFATVKENGEVLATGASVSSYFSLDNISFRV